MKDILIKFETSKLALEKVVPLFKDMWGWYTFYKPDNLLCKANETGLNMRYREHVGKLYPGITQSLLQKWLRENHNLHVGVQIGGFIDGKNTAYCNVFNFGKNKWISKFRSKTSVYTYEEALEIGLTAALNLI